MFEPGFSGLQDLQINGMNAIGRIRQIKKSTV